MFFWVCVGVFLYIMFNFVSNSDLQSSGER